MNTRQSPACGDDGRPATAAARLIIAGSRSVTDYQTAVNAIRRSGIQPAEIVSGGTRGASAMGERYAREHGIPFTGFPSRRKDGQGRFLRAAGHIRNTAMATYAAKAGPGNAALIALWNGSSRGTRHMIEQARKHGLMVYIEIVKPSRAKPQP